MRFAFIRLEKACFTVSMLCRVLQVSRAGFYVWNKNVPSKHKQEDKRLAELVAAAHDGSRKIYGAPRVHEALEKQGVRTSEKRVARLMKEAGLEGKRFKRFKVPTTDSKHTLPIEENMLAQDFTAQAPNQIWASDVTELVVPNHRLFLAVVLDIFSRKLVGWALSKVNDTSLVETALQRALSSREMNGLWIHHSDKGSPYASFHYRNLIDNSCGICSMSGAGNCFDNAVVESFNATLKRELGERFASDEEAEVKLFDFIEVFYNRERFHSTLGRGTSPLEFEENYWNAQSFPQSYQSPPAPPRKDPLPREVS
jgi:putative transposase